MRKFLFAVICFSLIPVEGHQGLPSDCRVDNCTDSVSRIDKTNTESYCSGLVTAWICLERILGNCYNIFEGYAKPEVNEMVNNITSTIEMDCHYDNSGSCPHVVYPATVFIALILLYVLK